MDKNSNRNDLFTRLFALLIFIIICLLYNNYRASVEYQKELQKKKDKEMSEFLRMYELESIKSNNEDIIPEETEYKESTEINEELVEISESMNVDEVNDVEESSSVEEPMETTSGYHGSNHGPSSWYWDIIDNMEERSQRSRYSSSSTRGKTSDSKRYSREDDLEDRAWEYMEAEGLDYDSAYEAAEED